MLQRRSARGDQENGLGKPHLRSLQIKMIVPAQDEHWEERKDPTTLVPLVLFSSVLGPERSKSKGPERLIDNVEVSGETPLQKLISRYAPLPLCRATRCRNLTLRTLLRTRQACFERGPTMPVLKPTSPILRRASPLRAAAVCHLNFPPS